MPRRGKHTIDDYIDSIEKPAKRPRTASQKTPRAGVTNIGSATATALANTKTEIIELPCVKLSHKFKTDLPDKELSDVFLSLKKIVNLEKYSTLTIGGQIIEELTYNSPMLFIGHVYAAIACPELGQQDLALEELKSDPTQCHQVVRKAIGALKRGTKVKVRHSEIRKIALKGPTDAAEAAQEKLERLLQAVSKCGNPLVALTVYTSQSKSYSKVVVKDPGNRASNEDYHTRERPDCSWCDRRSPRSILNCGYGKSPSWSRRCHGVDNALD